MFGALTPAGLTQVSGETADRIAADHVRCDEPVHGRDDRSVHRRAAAIRCRRRRNAIRRRGRSPSLDASPDRPRSRASATPMPRSTARRRSRDAFDPALERVGGGLWRFADHRRQRGAGIEHRNQPHLRRRGRRRLSLLAVHARRLCAGRRRHQLQRRQRRLAAAPTCSRPAPSSGTTSAPAYLSAALAYGWQDITTDRTVTIAGIDQLRAQFNANALSGRVEGGYRFVTPWMGSASRPTPPAQFTTFDLPAYAEQRDRRRQHLCAGLRRQERHRDAQRTRPAHRQILRDAGCAS